MISDMCFSPDISMNASRSFIIPGDPGTRTGRCADLFTCHLLIISFGPLISGQDGGRGGMGRAGQCVVGWGGGVSWGAMLMFVRDECI